MEAFINKLDYRFKNEALLKTALTHPSYNSDSRAANYQRLEFLGDAVLEFTISEYLFNALKNVDEGKLTRMRAELVREETLCSAARALGLGECIRLSAGEERTGGRDKPSILADVMEAVFAAIYLDGGMDEAKRVILSALSSRLNSSDECVDAKSRLQELMQREGRQPAYEFIEAQGPPHAPVFRYSVLDGATEIGRGEGGSKQAAQQAAAREALRRMGAK